MATTMPRYTSIERPVRASMESRPPACLARPRSNHLLNHLKKPVCSTCPEGGSGLRMVAHSAGVRINATSTDRPIADTSVIENCR